MSCRKKSTVIVAALFAAIWVSAVIGSESYIFVDGSCGNDAWSGRYSQCFGPDGYKRTIQAALDAIPDGGNIVVRDGIYGGSGNRDLDFHGKAVRLIGGDCIIDCGGTTSEQHRAFHFYSGETQSSSVEGFTITNGMAWKGGAVLCTNSSPKFLNCTFQGNEATEDDTGGGAVYNDDSSPTFESCTFADNIAMPSASYGGAITNEASSPTLTDCTFSNNQAWAGGGIYNTDSSNPVLENCIFIENQAVRGAGMGNSGSSPTLSRCTFTGNSASYCGGGIYNSFGSNPTLTHCTFTDNSAIDGGGMANWGSSPAVINCLFAANSATDLGGAVSNDASFTQLINCTIYGNSAPNGGGIASFDDSRVTTTNSILWDNSPNQVYNDDPACNQILYSCIEDGWSGAGNTGGDPLFADPDGPDNTLGTEDDDFSLTAGSACIDAGKNSVVPPTLLTDLAGLARFSDDLQTPDTGSGTPPIIDMGAREFQGLFYVDDTASGANNGTSWADAFTSLQNALAAASSGAEIRVAQGIYAPDLGSGITPGSRQATFDLFSDLTLRGGYAGFGATDPDARNINEYLAILTGDLAGNDGTLADPAELLGHPSRSENSFHVVTIGQDAQDVTLDGFVVTGGNANGDYVAGTDCGAGIYKTHNQGGSVITGCTLIANSAAGQGGGLFNDGPVTVDRCRFIGNFADSGGAMENNTDWDDPAVLTNCLFTGNLASDHGGAIGTTCASIYCTNCTFTLNRAEGTFYYRGGGITGDDDTEMYLTSCVFRANSDTDGMIESSQIDQDYISQTHVNYCCVQGWTGILGGAGNFGNDPLFIDADGDDNTTGTEDDNARLAAGSPCIDAGDPGFEPFPGETDLDGLPRVAGSVVDIGTYENQGDIPEDCVIYVDDDAIGSNDGSSWANAFTYLQDAFAVASSECEVRVAQGTYRPDQGAGIAPGSRDASFRLMNNVILRGGYAGLAGPDHDAWDAAAYQTVLSGDLSGNDIEVAGPADLLTEPTRNENSRNVVTAAGCDRTAVIDGFTITGGNANGPTEVLKYGGGIYDGTPTVRNCTITGNSAATAGGGMYFSGWYYSAQSLIIDCIITHNAAASGGGIYGCPELSNCVINANAATTYSGGGVFLGQGCDTAVTDCTFSNNTAVTYGGGVILGVSGSAPIFTRCVFTANSTQGSGGAVASDGCTCGTYPEFHQCTFTGNTAEAEGGAFYSFGYSLPTLLSCLLTGNHSGTNGGAFSHGWGAGSYIANCTIANNTAGVWTGGIFYEQSYSYQPKVVANCILWGNSDGTTQPLQDQQILALGTGSIPYIDHCCIEGWTGGTVGNNFALDPQFVDDDGPDNIPGNQDDNLRLDRGSPCINRGKNEYVPADGKDLDGNSRILNGTVDVGAYEYYFAGVPPIYVDDSAAGANDGSSWINAFRYLQDAIEAARDGGEIHIAQGVYRPDQGDEVSTGDRYDTFQLGSNMVLKGGYAGLGAPDPNAWDPSIYETILSGDLAGNDVEVADARDLQDEPTRADNSENIVTVVYYSFEQPPSELIGLTITGGNTQYSGAGMLLPSYTSAAIADCIFINNSAGSHGGAACFWNSRATFKRCRFIRNAAWSGGAAYLDGCGTCQDSYALFQDCILNDNAATGSGGAVCSNSNTLTSFINCIIAGNSANVVTGTAPTYGGALYDGSSLGSSLVNCAIIGNTGAGIYIRFSDVALTNCILWDNRFEAETGLAAQIRFEGQQPDVAYCCIQGWDGSLGGAGNIAGDPRFVDPGSWDIDLDFTPGNYHLRADSPCINTGDPSYVPEPFAGVIPTEYAIDRESCYVAKSSDADLDGNSRMVGGRVDMGAYEFYVSALVAHWKLDESEGDIAEDSAGDNDGVLRGNPQWRPSEGRVGGALLFDGEDDYVNCGSDTVFDITAQISLAAWVRINAVNMEWQTVIAKGDSAWRLSTAEDEYRYCFAVTGGPPWNYISGDTVVAANEWHHVCGTYDGEDLRLYIDGGEDPAGPVPEAGGVTTDEYDVLIGENQERPGRYWDGMIDDVRIYNYALSAAEVGQLFSPTVIYVDADARGANNGSCWADAFNCLQDALAIATEGAEIRVAQGTYRPDCGDGITPGDRTATFGLKNAVAIKGGYAGFGQPNPDARDISEYPTILSGDLLGNDGPQQANRTDNSRHVATASATDANAVLDGVTITAGYADGIDGDYPFINNGAGIYSQNGSPTLTDCTFTENIAVLYDYEYGGLGAAIYNLRGSPIIRNCAFRQNSATGGHGAVYSEYGSPMISDCAFEDNDCGGAEFRHQTGATVIRCSFIGNVTGYGSGINCEYGSSPSISDCTFAGNIAWYDGGALRCYSDCAPVVTNCIFAGNKTTIQNGGAICALESSPVLANCTFVGNSANLNGGAIHCYNDSHLQVANSILWGNSAADGGQISLTYYQHPGQDPCATEITLSYCDVQGGSEGILLEEMCYANWEPGNIDVDPRFVSPGYWNSNTTPGDTSDDYWVDGDYHLKSFGWRWDTMYEEWTFDRVTSRCIDAGNPGSPLLDEPLTVPSDPDNDYGRNLRINMGAYGGTAEASMPPYDWALLADISNDGIVDFSDFAYAGPDWLSAAPQQPCDLDRNGAVAPPDLDLFADDWLRKTTWRE